MNIRSPLSVLGACVVTTHTASPSPSLPASLHMMTYSEISKWYQADVPIDGSATVLLLHALPLALRAELHSRQRLMAHPQPY